MPHPILYADLTGPIVDFCVSVIKDTGLGGIFLLMAAGNACLPVPSEAVMLFAGFSVFEGDQTLLGVTLAGVAGSMAGSWLTYGIGWFGRVDLLERNRLFHVSPSRLAWVDRWFQRYGSAAVLAGRLVPVVRAFVSLPAGVAKMPFWRFTWLSTLGSIPWVFGLALLGQAVGSQWEDWRHNLGYFDYVVVAAIATGGVYLVLKRRRGEGGDEREPLSQEAAASAEPARSSVEG
jgi:membrane protein DedA with SNARE-associated domain